MELENESLDSGLWSRRLNGVGERRYRVGGASAAGESVKADNGATIGRRLLARRDLNFEDFGEGEKRERKR